MRNTLVIDEVPAPAEPRRRIRCEWLRVGEDYSCWRPAAAHRLLCNRHVGLKARQERARRRSRAAAVARRIAWRS